MKNQFENQTKKKFSLNKQVISEVEASQINGGISAGLCLSTVSSSCGKTLVCPDPTPHSLDGGECSSQSCSTTCARCS